jgi:hypothetical protein
VLAPSTRSDYDTVIGVFEVRPAGIEMTATCDILYSFAALAAGQQDTCSCSWVVDQKVSYAPAAAVLCCAVLLFLLLLQRWQEAGGYQTRHQKQVEADHKDLGSLADTAVVNLLTRFFQWYVEDCRRGDPAMKGKQVRSSQSAGTSGVSVTATDLQVTVDQDLLIQAPMLSYSKAGNVSGSSRGGAVQ